MNVLTKVLKIAHIRINFGGIMQYVGNERRCAVVLHVFFSITSGRNAFFFCKHPYEIAKLRGQLKNLEEVIQLLDQTLKKVA